MSLTITSLADLAEVSKQAISQYERGEDSPGQEVFDRLRKILRHEAHFFLRRPDDSLRKGTCFYRSMASTTKTARTKAEVWQTWARELISYVLQFIEFPAVTFPSFDVPSSPNLLGMDRIEAIASDVREFWNLGEGPIPNLVEVSENNGAVILRHGMDAETLDALSEWLEPEDFPLIILNADKSVSVRSRLDLGHELGHMFLHRGLSADQLKHSETFSLVEQQAFCFGADLLLPEHSFLEDLYTVSLDGLLSLKPKWKVSVAMMIERLLKLNIIDEERRRRLRINYSAREWNREEPYDNEIQVEQPTFLSRAIKLVVEGRIQTLGQISANTALGQEWIEKVLALPNDLFSQKPQLKMVEFKRHA